VSGLSAAWLLSQKHRVTLFEAEPRLGGHTHTVDLSLPDGRLLPVDTGFIVSNTWTYPNFSALMSYLDVEMVDTRMTFSVSADAGRFEYSGDHLGTLLGRARQWVQPTHWRLVADLVRFYKTAERHAKSLPDSLTLGQFLAQHGYSRSFIDHHILPIAGAIWSASTADIANYPFRAFVKFFANHKLFMLGDRPHWRTVKGGSRTYVERLVEDGKFETRLATPVTGIRRTPAGVSVNLATGTSEHFDHAVIATHGDQALRLLQDADDREVELLSPFKTSVNRAILHRDSSLMPHCKRFWSGWNYRANASAPQAETVEVTYWMNALQKLDSPVDHFVSLNPVVRPRAELIDRELLYRHPIFTPATLSAQRDLWDLQGRRSTWFAGAWFGAGFHEDGLQAGLAVAEQLGGLQRPWDVEGQSSRICVKQLSEPVAPAFIEAAE
jgi:uncharacterized protein